MKITGLVETYRITRVHIGLLKFLIWCAVAVFLLEDAYAARGNTLSYAVALSPDGSRIAVGKKQLRPRWELFEGVLQQPLRRITMPSGFHSTGVFVYSPDGNDLLFAAIADSAAEIVRASNRSSTKDVERITMTESLWRQRLSNDDASPPTKIFEYAGFSNVLPLLDGSIVFMGAVQRLKSHSPSPLFGGGHRVWANYSWMLRKPDGSITVINPRRYAFYSNASLIRDEAVFFVQERYVDRQPMNPREYQLDVTLLKPGVDLRDLTRLASMQDSRGGPKLQCNWSGEICARVMTYEKDGYYAHHLEIIRNGDVCKVNGLPDRLEKSAISRNGNAIALITRPNPYHDAGYQLALITIGADGCAASKKFFALP